MNMLMARSKTRQKAPQTARPDPAPRVPHCTEAGPA